MLQQGHSGSIEWATKKLEEIARKENRQIDDVSFNPISGQDAVELIIKSRGKKITHRIEGVFFKEDENMHRELEKRLRMLVKKIKPNP
jgi:hypothetical protein